MNQSQLLKHITLKSYLVGLSLSLFLTLASFILVFAQVESGGELFSIDNLVPLLLVFAMTQMAVQLIFFLHLLHEDKPRWNLVFFVSTFALILLVVVGSVWILTNLNYNMMPQQTTEFIIQDEGFNLDAVNN